MRSLPICDSTLFGDAGLPSHSFRKFRLMRIGWRREDEAVGESPR